MCTYSTVCVSHNYVMPKPNQTAVRSHNHSLQKQEQNQNSASINRTNLSLALAPVFWQPHQAKNIRLEGCVSLISKNSRQVCQHITHSTNTHIQRHSQHARSEVSWVGHLNESHKATRLHLFSSGYIIKSKVIWGKFKPTAHHDNNSPDRASFQQLMQAPPLHSVLNKNLFSNHKHRHC